MTEPTLRIATATDVSRIVELANSAYRPPIGRHGWTHESDIFDGGIRTESVMVQAIVDDAATPIIVAEIGEEIVGCVQVKLDGDVGAFGLLAVDPQRQAGGLGRQLVAAAEAHACSRGAREMRLQALDVRADLIAWYRRLGYEMTGEAQAFPSVDPRFGVARSPSLRLAVMAKPLAVAVDF